MDRRGQQAPQKLTLYLWVLVLLLLLAGLTWWTLVTSKAKAEGFTQLYVREHRLLTDGQLWLRLDNQASEEVFVSRIDAGQARTRPELRLPLGALSGWFSVNDTGRTGQAGEGYELQLTLFYALLRSGVPDRVSNGTLRGSFASEKPI